MERVTGIGGMFWTERGPVVTSRSQMQLHFDERSRRNNGEPPLSAGSRRPAERTMRSIVLIAAPSRRRPACAGALDLRRPAS